MYFLKFRIGICVPSSCSIEDVRSLAGYCTYKQERRPPFLVRVMSALHRARRLPRWTSLRPGPLLSVSVGKQVKTNVTVPWCEVKQKAVLPDYYVAIL
ncbi:hypothetical protein HPB48_003924 [Haemaphysalis longicornis]|uniref:Nose resistant-to-fluoxetine protein N-terminal domain-containing protein n=1 Tax=Haemaphysalis longicornis TaxID=44386 RepID=A0A9J6FED2_HAELO|nr:hypothetical protein HPB48_003924 [Haemaphysalis longicornis]